MPGLAVPRVDAVERRLVAEVPVLETGSQQSRVRWSGRSCEGIGVFGDPVVIVVKPIAARSSEYAVQCQDAVGPLLLGVL